MRLSEYLELRKIRPYDWVKETGLPQSGVYAWLAGTIRPNIKNIMKIKTATNGAVGPEDWLNGD